MLACTFVHRKFLGRTPPGKAVFRAFLGGTRNESLLSDTDEALVAIVRRELSEILGEKTISINVAPEHTQVSRWRAPWPSTRSDTRTASHASPPA
jgi:oxygen-dependent protoporphyrinogen oxidase